MRQYQQGFGRPIISVEVQGTRVVAVANSVKWSNNWKWFTDFLLDYLKDSLGREWGVEAQKRKLEHPLFRWLTRMNQVTLKLTDPTSGHVEHVQQGFLTSVFRLGYALYLIAHHDQLDQSVVKRLRMPQQFQAAYYETLIAAAFAVSGASIQMAERLGQSTTRPEFWAIGKSGRRYAVEAKCKSAWKSTCDPESQFFRDELRQWIRDQIYGASSKQLENPVYCFELSIPVCFEPDDWQIIHQLVKDALFEAETITVAGEPTKGAYVFVTNHAHLVNDDAEGTDQVAMLEGYRLDTFRATPVPLETALQWHDEHRDITWVMKCMEEIERIPSTFDGTPPEFFIAEQSGNRTLHIGGDFEFEFPDATFLRGKLRDVVSNGDRAHVVVDSLDGTQHIAEIPLTPIETTAAQAYGDAVFGKPQKRQKNMTEITDLYDWFLEVYAKYDVDALLRQLAEHPDHEQIAQLPLDELRVRVAREVTKAAYQTSKGGADGMS